MSRKPRGVAGCGLNEKCLASFFLHLSGARNGYDVEMNPSRKPSPTESPSPLLFELDDEPLQETLTAWGCVPLVVQAFRSMGVPASVRQHVRIKQRELGRRCPEQRTATVDQDATIIESHKREALRTYEGERGYQPMLAVCHPVDKDPSPGAPVWAEMDAVLADEFRDGNVPAMMAPLAVAKRAFAALPETVTSYYYRGDSASHEKELLRAIA